MHRGTRFASVLLLGAGCHGAHAWQFDYLLELGLLHSDNINLDAGDPVSQNVLIPRLGFTLSESGSAVQAEASGLLEFRDYLGDAYASEVRGTLNAVLNWTLVPERLMWTFADNLGMYPVDLREPDTPDNVQRVNVFTTGPTWRFRLAPTWRGQVELRYADSDAEENAGFDSTRLAGAFRLGYELSPTRRVLGNLEVRSIDFDNDTLATDYDRYDVYAGYAQTLNQFDMEFALGYSHLDFAGGRDASGPLARASLDWRAGARNTFGLGLAWQFSDAATQMSEASGSLQNPLGAVGIGHVDVSPDVYKERRIEGRHGYEGARVVTAAHVYLARFEYEQVTSFVSQDRDDRGIAFDLGYRVRPLIRLGVLAGTDRREYRQTRSSDRDRYYGVYLTQQWARHWSWRLDLTRNERDAADGSLSYDENVAHARVTYTR